MYQGMLREQSGLTSQHHMAAEATIRKMRQFVRNARKAKMMTMGSEGAARLKNESEVPKYSKL